ncbi:MAG TPA: ribokinase [Anaerolineaceae bacterium]|nr:ribokinase [Anaerolineaceae bacterium]HPN51483.1 ribokinase [Anaerolineaceae bacterium]
MPKIVVVGSANTDLTIPVNQLPVLGENITGGILRVSQGGKGANQAVAAARLGAEVTLIARVGSDSFGQETRRAYEIEGIHTEFLVNDPIERTGTSFILVDKEGGSMVVNSPGSNANLSVDDVKAAEKVIRSADCLLLQLEVPLAAVQAAAEIASRYGVRVILNPSPATPMPEALTRCVNILTPNEIEATQLAGGYTASHAREAVMLLSLKTGIHTIVVTMGMAGALVLDEGQKTAVPAFMARPVDSSGAGDAFNGGLAVALARGKSLADAVRYANAAAAITVTRPGTQSSLPDEHEVDEFLAARQRISI